MRIKQQIPPTVNMHIISIYQEKPFVPTHYELYKNRINLSRQSSSLSRQFGPGSVQIWVNSDQEIIQSFPIEYYYYRSENNRRSLFDPPSLPVFARKCRRVSSLCRSCHSRSTHCTYTLRVRNTSMRIIPAHDSENVTPPPLFCLSRDTVLRM